MKTLSGIWAGSDPVNLRCQACGDTNTVRLGTGKKVNSTKNFTGEMLQSDNLQAEKFLCHRGHAGWLVISSPDFLTFEHWTPPAPTALELVTLNYQTEWGKGTKTLMKGIISSFLHSLDHSQYDNQTLNRLCDEAEIGHIVGEEDEEEEEPF